MTDAAKNISPQEFSELMADLISGVDVGIVATEMVHCLAVCYNLCALNRAPDSMASMREMLQGLLDAMNAALPDGDEGHSNPPPVLH